VQPENAPYPMLVTLSGIVMLVRPLQSPNAHSPMLVTLLGIVTRAVLPSGHWMSVIWLLLNKTPSRAY